MTVDVKKSTQLLVQMFLFVKTDAEDVSFWGADCRRRHTEQRQMCAEASNSTVGCSH